MPRVKNISLHNLAKYLGLSKTTVSRGLAGYPEVSIDTQRRIKDAALLLNYAPNNHATRLSKGTSKTIGQIIPMSDHIVLNPIFADFIAGASEVYAEHDFDLLFSAVKNNKELQSYKDLANSGKVDGFVVSEPKINDQRFSLLEDLGVPYVVHGRSNQKNDEVEFHWVDVDNQEAFYNATKYLLKFGFRKIAFLNGHKEMNFAIERQIGFERALEEHKITLKNEWIHFREMSEQEGYKLTTSILESEKWPEAILCSSYLMALGALRALQEKRLAVGLDLSIICWDDCLSFLKQTNGDPYFTCIQSSIFDAGRHVAEMMMDIIQRPREKFQKKLIKTKFVVGKTTPCLE